MWQEILFLRDLACFFIKLSRDELNASAFSNEWETVPHPICHSLVAPVKASRDASSPLGASIPVDISGLIRRKNLRMLQSPGYLI